MSRKLYASRSAIGDLLPDLYPHPLKGGEWHLRNYFPLVFELDVGPRSEAALSGFVMPNARPGARTTSVAAAAVIAVPTVKRERRSTDMDLGIYNGPRFKWAKVSDLESNRFIEFSPTGCQQLWVLPL